MSSLQDARAALQRGDLEQVQIITADLLKNDPDSADAWYMLSHAVEGDRQQIFMQKALDLDPEIEDRFVSESDTENLADELFDFNSSEFPDLDGPTDDDDTFGDVDDVDDLDDTDDVFEADEIDDFVGESESFVVADSFEEAPSEPEVPSMVNESKTSVESGTSFDMNLIILVGLGLVILVVAYLFVRSLIG